jgi:hypothetical protein
MPASSITTSVVGPIRSAQRGRSLCWMDQVSLARVSVLVSIWLLRAAAAAADGASPISVPPPSVQARARARIAVVFPAPAGAMASCSRAPEMHIWRTRAAWPAFSGIPLAAISSSARSTADGSTEWPSRRAAVASSRCSACSTRAEVNRAAPATV